MSQPDSNHEGLSVASHGVLFERAEPSACDACGCAIRAELDDRDAAQGPDPNQGTGAYLWVRGDRIELEIVPLCASCASAIGMSALARWEIEEEEG